MVPKLREKFLPGISVDLILDFFGVATPSQETDASFQTKNFWFEIPRANHGVSGVGGGGGENFVGNFGNFPLLSEKLRYDQSILTFYVAHL